MNSMTLSSPLKVGKSYFYWDPVVGKIDEGLGEVVELFPATDTVKIINLQNGLIEVLPVKGLCSMKF